MAEQEDDFDLGLDDDLADDAEFDPLEEEEEDGDEAMAEDAAKESEVVDPNDPRVQRPDVKPRLDDMNSVYVG